MNYSINLKLISSALAAASAIVLTALSAPVCASSFTRTSPTIGGELPAGHSEVGGIVLDLVGTNEARVTSQLPASRLFRGFNTPNPLTIGAQSGFDSSILNRLGGGLQEAAVRLTLYDGDTAAGMFDFNDNYLLVNGLNFGNFSAVNAQNTDSQGNLGVAGFSGGGFRSDLLDTGWFYVTDAGLLGRFYNSLVSSGQAKFALNDADPGENFFDFTQGLDSSQTNVERLPKVIAPPQPTPPTMPPVPAPPSQSVPEPTSLLALLAVGALGVGSTLKSK
jgi:hypothetical protein